MSLYFFSIPWRRADPWEGRRWSSGPGPPIFCGWNGSLGRENEGSVWLTLSSLRREAARCTRSKAAGAGSKHGGLVIGHDCKLLYAVAQGLLWMIKLAHVVARVAIRFDSWMWGHSLTNKLFKNFKFGRANLYFSTFVIKWPMLQLDWIPSRNTHNINFRTNQKGYVCTTNPRPPLENSSRGESKSAWSSFVKVISDLFFKTTFQIMSEHHWTKWNRIHMVESSCSKVSDPSEVPLFVRELIF